GTSASGPRMCRSPRTCRSEDDSGLAFDRAAHSGRKVIVVAASRVARHILLSIAHSAVHTSGWIASEVPHRVAGIRRGDRETTAKRPKGSGAWSRPMNRETASAWEALWESCDPLVWW